MTFDARRGRSQLAAFEKRIMTDFVHSAISFIRDHEVLGSALVFLLAFCESFAFVSLLVPATGILLGLGGLIQVFGIRFWPIWIAAALGAIAGDWLAFSLSIRARAYLRTTGRFAINPHLLARATELIGRWGMIAVFIGRFFGPLRAVVPIAAGICAMPWLKFQIANFASALVWASAILAPGFFGARWLMG
jgi:membrane protein DedA with SNARE-associated domain